MTERAPPPPALADNITWPWILDQIAFRGRNVKPLPSGASTAEVAAKVNELIAVFQESGTLREK